MRRVLTKISVVRCALDQLGQPIVDLSQTSADITASSGEEGTSSCEIPRAMVAAVDDRAPRAGFAAAGAPTRKRATSSIGFCVADKPIRMQPARRTAREPLQRQRKMRRRACCDAMAWISSTITVRVVFNIARPDSEPSRM